jgi:hypothetical protein
VAIFRYYYGRVSTCPFCYIFISSLTLTDG